MKETLLLLASLSLFLSCGTKTPAVSVPQEKTSPLPAQFSKEGFTPDGALFTNGKIYQDAWEIKNLLDAAELNNRMVLSRATLQKLPHDSTHYYEIGHYKSMEAGINQFAFIIAWEKLGTEWLKELEVLYPAHDNPKGNPFLISKARDEWMFFSNDHNPEGLVNEVYATDAVYFNNGTIYTGRQSITQKYQYMAKPSWQIKLSPEKVLAVRDDIYFEIGSYQSSGHGHYLLVWEKQNQDSWQAILDFNF